MGNCVMATSGMGQGPTCRPRHRCVRIHPNSGCPGIGPSSPASGPKRTDTPENLHFSLLTKINLRHLSVNVINLFCFAV